MVPLTPTAAAVMAEIVRVPGSPWVFAGATPDRHLSQLTSYWHRVRERADLEDVRIHDLRHSFASRALALGESLSMIGRLLGHTDVGSTARYAHLARDAEKVAAATVGDSIEADILPQETVAQDDRGCIAASGRIRHTGGTGFDMAKLRYTIVLSKRTVDGLSVEDKDVIIWDRELQGFGVRVYPSGAKVYLVQSRGPRGSKRIALGRHGVVPTDRARRRAALVIARIKAGEEPVPSSEERSQMPVRRWPSSPRDISRSTWRCAASRTRPGDIAR